MFENGVGDNINTPQRRPLRTPPLKLVTNTWSKEMVRNSTQQRGKETTQPANKQEENNNEETPRSGNHEAWMTETKRILVWNIGNSTKKDIRTMFARLGPITEIKMPINRLTRRQAGFAFVTFKTAKHGAAATSTLNGTGFQDTRTDPQRQGGPTGRQPKGCYHGRDAEKK